MSNESVMYVKFIDLLGNIHNANNEVIGRFKLVDCIVPFFGKTYLRVNLESEIFKCYFPGILSSDLKVFRNRKLLYLYEEIRSGNKFIHKLELIKHTIEYFKVPNSENYEVYLNKNIVGSINYNCKCDLIPKGKGIGAKILCADEILVPTLFFALLQKDYFGRMT